MEDGKKKTALIFNFLSAITFLIGGLITYFASNIYDVSFLIPFAAGNFIYIGASDLFPEINKHKILKINIMHFASFIFGLSIMLIIKLLFD